MVLRALLFLLGGLVVANGYGEINPAPTDVSPKIGQLDDVRFLLWTRSNSGDDAYYRLIPENLTNLIESPFEGMRSSHVMYHGYTGKGLTSWIRQAKSALLALDDCNVISVDWQTLVPSPWYLAAYENTFKVANYTANFLDWLNQETGLQPSNIHIVGHSLGAQAAGLTGHYVKSGTVSRVTGLDPAGPLWYENEPENRLDKTSAEFVDVIHTNSGTIPEGCIAMIKNVGHIDFYPNGGQHQPGCEDGGGTIIEDWLDLFQGCSHDRAEFLWVESISALEPDHMFKAWPCKDWDTFANESCRDCLQGCPYMGFHVGRPEDGLYYLNTNDESPYARGDDQFSSYV